MQSVVNHIEQLKGKPYHHRKRITYLYAGIGAGAIGLVWLIASLATGAFLIHDSLLTRDSSGEGTAVIEANQRIAGAAAALTTDAGAPAELKIIDTKPTSARTKQPEHTVMPF